MLWPCSECQRHIRSTERTCPFCGCSVSSATEAPAFRYPHPGLSRAAKVAFFVTLAGASVANCAAPSPRPVSPAEPQKAEAPPDEWPLTEPSSGSDAGSADATTDAASSAIDEDAAQHRVVAIYGSSEIIVLEYVKFKPFSDQISKSDDAILDSVAEVMKHHTFEIEVEGFAAPNEKVPGLAKRRAQKVVDALVVRGVPKDRMQAVDRMLKPDPKRPPPHSPSVRFHVVQ